MVKETASMPDSLNRRPLTTAGSVLTHIRSQEPGARSQEQEPGARSQEPGARSQEPGARSQEPGARSQEPGARSQEPGARSQEPGARSQEPGARSQEPGARSQEPGLRLAFGEEPPPGLIHRLPLPRQLTRGTRTLPTRKASPAAQPAGSLPARAVLGPEDASLTM